MLVRFGSSKSFSVCIGMYVGIQASSTTRLNLTQVTTVSLQYSLIPCKVLLLFTLKIHLRSLLDQAAGLLKLLLNIPQALLEPVWIEQRLKGKTSQSRGLIDKGLSAALVSWLASATCYIIRLMSQDTVYMFPQKVLEECLLNKHSYFLCLYPLVVFYHCINVCHRLIHFPEKTYYFFNGYF